MSIPMNERYQLSASSILAATHHKLSGIFIGPQIVNPWPAVHDDNLQNKYVCSRHGSIIGLHYTKSVSNLKILRGFSHNPNSVVVKMTPISCPHLKANAHSTRWSRRVVKWGQKSINILQTTLSQVIIQLKRECYYDIISPKCQNV